MSLLLPRSSLLVLLLLNIATLILPLDATRHEVQLDEKYVFAWEVDKSTNTITLEATAKTLGYVGLGIGQKGKMDKAEMSIGGVHPSMGTSYSGVYVGHGHKVKLDESRKWTLISARTNDTHTHVKYQRPLGSSYSRGLEDPDYFRLNNYIPIKDKDLYVIWAVGKSDKLKKHKGHGKFKVNLINPHTDYLRYLNRRMFDYSLEF